jgi:uncharacterized protein YceK
MRRTAVAWACVLPVLAGCGSVRSSVSSDGGLHRARSDASADHRRDAEAAWDGLRARNPRAFTDEFRDGFVDGYADFCDRGPGCQPPPVPPVPYSRYKRFLGRGGADLVNDYYAGFQHGADTAAGPRFGTPAPPSAEPRPYAPTPSEMPTPRPPDTGKFGEPKRGSDSPPGGAARALPLPKPELPVVKPFNPDLSGNKFASTTLADPDRLPRPAVPLPIPSPELPPVTPPAPPPRVPSVLDAIPPLPAPPK